MSVPKEQLKDKPKPLPWAFDVKSKQDVIDKFKKHESQKSEQLYDDVDTDTDDECDIEVQSITNSKLKS